jgi:hypothetical protein
MTAHYQSNTASWAWTGAIAAPLCWAAQQLLVACLVPQHCHGRQWLVPSIWGLFAIVLLVATVISWRARARVSAVGEPSDLVERRALFAGTLGIVMPLMFLVAMTWQGIAGMIYSGCER